MVRTDRIPESYQTGLAGAAPDGKDSAVRRITENRGLAGVGRSLHRRRLVLIRSPPLHVIDRRSCVDGFAVGGECSHAPDAPANGCLQSWKLIRIIPLAFCTTP